MAAVPMRNSPSSASRIRFHEKNRRQPLRTGWRPAPFLSERELARVGGVLTGLLSSARVVRLPESVPPSMTTLEPHLAPDISNRYIRSNVSPDMRRFARPAPGRKRATKRNQEGTRMSRRSAMLELAILGLLHESPLHGYELRKRLNTVLGAFRALSYGTLYPCLRDLVARGWIAESTSADLPGAPGSAPGSGSRRARIVYEFTAKGK